MTLPYAEQFLIDAQQNQWFIQFHIRDNNFDSDQLLQQMEWFAQHNLIVQEVQTVHFKKSPTGFFHVNFQGKNDPRLVEYSSKWEDELGNSLYPNQYQMYEWSYASWLQDGSDQTYQQHLQRLSDI